MAKSNTSSKQSSRNAQSEGGTAERRATGAHHRASPRNGTSGSARGNAQRGGSSAGGSSAKSNPDSGRQRRGSRQQRQSSAGLTGSLRSVGTRAVSTVGEHPIPALMIGTGLALWMLENRTGLRRAEERVLEASGEALSGIGHTVVDAAGTARDALTGAAEVVGRTVGTAAESVAEGVAGGASRIGEFAQTGASAVGEGLRTTASALADGAYEGYEYGRETMNDLWENHPVAMCAGLLAAGVTIGMMLPSTRAEGQLLGGTAGALAERVKDKGGEWIERGRRFATRAAEMVVGESESGGEQASGQTGSRRARRGGGQRSR